MPGRGHSRLGLPRARVQLEINTRLSASLKIPMEGDHRERAQDLRGVGEAVPARGEVLRIPVGVEEGASSLQGTGGGLSPLVADRKRHVSHPRGVLLLRNRQHRHHDPLSHQRTQGEV